MRCALALLLLTACLAAAPVAAEEACAGLSPQQRALVEQALGSYRLYDCCDATVADCLKQQPPCRLAGRIEQYVCRLAAIGADQRRIEAALNQRRLSMTGPPQLGALDLSSAGLAGDPLAPVKLTVYLCLRCRFCASLLPWLYQEVTTGQLVGKVELRLKLFPLNGHQGSQESGAAALAARQQGRMFEFMLYAYAHYDEFSVERLPQWAADMGLDVARFEAAYADEATRRQLAADKREGYANNVHATPTLFINDRLYQGFIDRETLLDMLDEEYERSQGLLCKPQPE